MTQQARILSITVDRPIEVVAAYLSNPLNFPLWASGLADGIAPFPEDAGEGGDSTLWTAQTRRGEVAVRFSQPNAFGVADHWVFPPDGTTVYVPLRAVANGGGAEVSLTLFQVVGMDQQQFDEDAQLVMRDLNRLKTVLEGSP